MIPELKKWLEQRSGREFSILSLWQGPCFVYHLVLLEKTDDDMRHITRVLSDVTVRHGIVDIFDLEIKSMIHEMEHGVVA